VVLGGAPRERAAGSALPPCAPGRPPPAAARSGGAAAARRRTSAWFMAACSASAAEAAVGTGTGLISGRRGVSRRPNAPCASAVSFTLSALLVQGERE